MITNAQQWKDEYTHVRLLSAQMASIRRAAQRRGGRGDEYRHLIRPILNKACAIYDRLNNATCYPEPEILMAWQRDISNSLRCRPRAI